ncbi:MAG TPA: methyltransferase domain-containing protein [Acidimicrobiales bacterium]|nr:methyltransferase domain-containing protein [Acidimicrobiales bacterium]
MFGPRARAALARAPWLHHQAVVARAALRRTRSALRRDELAALAPDDAVRLVYDAMLRRPPDPGALEQFVPALAAGAMSVADLVDGIRTSEEYRVRTPIQGHNLLRSLHLSRIEFILGLPRAARIVDLGGSATYSDMGALVLLGYPYDFEQLTIVDLPPDERHPLYRSDRWEDVTTARGPVHYELRSMTDLAFAEDASVDLVYSGQSIEHVTLEDARAVAAEVARILRPGGVFALDTPNAEVCRLQTPDFIDPDHEHEYTLDELVALLAGAGFDVVERKGLNLGARAASVGHFDADELAANHGVFADARACYLLAVVARKPG